MIGLMVIAGGGAILNGFWNLNSMENSHKWVVL